MEKSWNQLMRTTCRKRKERKRRRDATEGITLRINLIFLLFLYLGFHFKRCGQHLLLRGSDVTVHICDAYSIMSKPPWRAMARSVNTSHLSNTSLGIYSSAFRRLIVPSL